MEKHSFVMMIDDDQLILNIIRRILEMEGDASSSANVKEVLARLDECRPNMVIMDIETPDLASPEVVEMCRADSGTPALMLTTRCEVTTLHGALAACTSRGGGKPPPARELLADILSKLRKAVPGNITQN